MLMELVERKRVRLWSGTSEVQTSGRSNRTQCYQQLATAAKFRRKEMWCPGATIHVDESRQLVIRFGVIYMQEYNEKFDLI